MVIGASRYRRAICVARGDRPPAPGRAAVLTRQAGSTCIRGELRRAVVRTHAPVGARFPARRDGTQRAAESARLKEDRGFVLAQTEQMELPLRALTRPSHLGDGHPTNKYWLQGARVTLGSLGGGFFAVDPAGRTGSRTKGGKADWGIYAIVGIHTSLGSTIGCPASKVLNEKSHRYFDCTSQCRNNPVHGSPPNQKIGGRLSWPGRENAPPHPPVRHIRLIRHIRHDIRPTSARSATTVCHGSHDSMPRHIGIIRHGSTGNTPRQCPRSVSAMVKAGKRQ